MKKSLFTLLTVMIISLTAILGCSNFDAKETKPLGIIGAMEEEEVETLKSKMDIKETRENSWYDFLSWNY